MSELVYNLEEAHNLPSNPIDRLLLVPAGEMEQNERMKLEIQGIIVAVVDSPCATRTGKSLDEEFKKSILDAINESKENEQ